MNPLKTFFFLLCMILLGACKEDYVYPDVITEFTEIQTSLEGKPSHLLTDHNLSFTISDSPSGYRYRPDTLYRELSVYQLLEEGSQKVRLYSSHPVFSPIPICEQDFNGTIKTDPVEIQSIWLSERYLNLILDVQVKDQGHSFAFIEQGIQTRADGSHTFLFLLHHDRRNDYEAFTQKLYASIPLWVYEGKLKKGDLIQLQLNTRKEGKIIKEFNY